MNRRPLLAARRSVILRAVVLSLAIAGPASVVAQGTDRVVRLGFVDPDSQSRPIPAGKAFWQRLRELGWVEGKNLSVVYRAAEGHSERFPALVGEVLSAKVDVLVTSTTPGALAARNATATVPIVVLAFGDPVGNGLAQSLAHPGGNLTGFSLEHTEGVTRKFVELTREMVPGTLKIAVISNPDSPQIKKMIAHLKSVSAAQRVELRFIDVLSPRDFTAAFAAARQNTQAALVLADPLTVTHRATITDLATKYRVPALYTMLEFVRDGGLAAYGADQGASFRSAAEYVDKILRGANPGDLPIQQPAQLRLIVNLRTAKAIGVSIAPSFLARADELIE